MEREFKQRRKIYLVMKNFQLKYIILGILLFIFTLVIAQANFYYQVTRLLLQEPQLTGTSQILHRMNAVFIGWFVLGLILIILGGLLVSHRIVGPLKRLEHSLAHVAEGQLNEEMHTREKDEFKEVTNAFNKMSQSLKTFLENDKKLATEISADLQALIAYAKNTSSTAEQKAELEKHLNTVIEKEGKLFSSFKI